VTSSRGYSSSLALLAAAGLIGLCLPVVQAAKVYMAAASQQGRAYQVEVDALVSVPEPRARELLTDYAHLGRINPDIRVSEILLTRGPGDYRVRTVSEVCVWFYCKRIHQVQDVSEAADGSVTATVIPEQSDFRYGYVRLHLWQVPGGTRVLIRGELEPDFWIPPVIGPWLVKRKLLSEALDTLQNLERVAKPAPAPQASASKNAAAVTSLVC